MSDLFAVILSMFPLFSYTFRLQRHELTSFFLGRSPAVTFCWIGGPMRKRRPDGGRLLPTFFAGTRCVRHLSPFLSIIHPEKTITPLFSSTHPDQFFCPFVFNQPSRAIFIFNIFFPSPLCFQSLIGRYFSRSTSLGFSAPVMGNG